MIYQTPELSGLDEQVLGEIEALRDDLRFQLATPRRWHGTLRRVMVARAVQASTTIEGFHTTVAEAAAIIDGEVPADVDADTRLAVAGYRDAMTYVLQLTAARDSASGQLRLGESMTSTDESGLHPYAAAAAGGGERLWLVPAMDASLLKALHFMMVKHDLSAHPGTWRSDAVWVSDASGAAVYEGPSRQDVEPLVDALLAYVNGSPDVPLITAAMAHLNLTLIHPFTDGNGRMARCLQSFVLGRADGQVSPVFASIEEYLGRDTRDYYQALTDTADGSWSPQRSARPWLEFCLTAHYHQAARVRRRIDLFSALWDRCEQVAAGSHLPDRCVDSLVHSARGWRLDRRRYISITGSALGESISEAMATRDLTAMVAAGLIEPVGEKRGRYYLPSTSLQAIADGIQGAQPKRATLDPYRRGR